METYHPYFLTKNHYFQLVQKSENKYLSNKLRILLVQLLML
jgi:hypothetical protein